MSIAPHIMWMVISSCLCYQSLVYALDQPWLQPLIQHILGICIVLL